jgi:dinuclear metal center YbgI/SA1388 family protein
MPKLTLADCEQAMQDRFDLRLAEDWDNVGCICGDPAQPVRRALLTIDVTKAVLAEASSLRCDLIVAYHPTIFSPIRRVVAGDGASGLVHEAISRRLAIFSLHTVLDLVDGGTSDVLADAIGLTERRPLQVRSPEPGRFKVVTFVPAESQDRVSQVMFAAGAGQIGKYSSCSFRAPGHGSFLGGPSASPAIGQRGQLEQVEEWRLETVVDSPDLQSVIEALREVHPYEEPAYDVYPLVRPSAGGIGRIGRLSRPATARRIVSRIKRALGVPRVLAAGLLDKMVRTAACSPGSAGDLLYEAIRSGCDLYLTGELRHHDALVADRDGIAIVCVGHSNSERPALTPLADVLHGILPSVSFGISRTDADPFVVI